MDREQALTILQKILQITDECLRLQKISLDSNKGNYSLKLQCDMNDDAKQNLQEILDKEKLQLKQEEDFFIIS